MTSPSGSLAATLTLLGLLGAAAPSPADPPQKVKDKKEQKAAEKEDKRQDKQQGKQDKQDKKEQKPGKAKKQHHNNGKAVLGAALKSNGHHVLGKKGSYTTSAEVRDGKVTGVHVQHATRGDVKVTKYKTNKKMAMARREPVQVASLEPIEPMEMQVTITIYIGYGYYDDEDDYEDIYWFPVDDVYDGDAGAIDYYGEPY